MEEYTRQDIEDLKKIGLHIIRELENDLDKQKQTQAAMQEEIEQMKTKREGIRKAIEEMLQEG